MAARGLTVNSVIEELKTNTVSAWPLVILRVGIGIMFILAGYGKVARGAGFGDAMAGFLSRQENTFGFYQGFIDNVVLPNKVLFGYLVAWGELLSGIALVIGLFTRWAALAMLFMVLNFWFAKGSGYWVPSNHDSLYIMIALVLLLSRAGHTLGIDGLLARRGEGAGNLR